MNKKLKLMIPVLGILVVGTAGWTSSSSEKASSDRANQIEVTKQLEESQPTPTDVDYSLERYNLIRRAYWVNGQRDKAEALASPTELPLGHIALISEGAVVAQFDVAGKVSSLNSMLTPSSLADEINDCTDGTDFSCVQDNVWLADVDGSYGVNAEGVFFFTPEGRYVEWAGEYIYTDAYMDVNPIIDVDVSKGTE